jgi:hypothetical protein
MAKTYTAARNFKDSGKAYLKGDSVSISAGNRDALVRRGFIKETEAAPATSGTTK